MHKAALDWQCDTHTNFGSLQVHTVTATVHVRLDARGGMIDEPQNIIINREKT
jgi:hypothetical protein